MAPTEEQLLIINSRANFLRVNAFAGTGKTSTLVNFSIKRPKERILYIAFNKSIQEEGTRKFPSSNVHCVTSHGLAFAAFGARYAEAQKLTAKVRVNEALDALDISTDFPSEFRLFVADAALRCVERYLVTEDPTITIKHTNGLLTPDSGIEPEDIVELASRLWARMYNIKDSEIGITHDGYLKLYQLSNPRLNYDRIFLDESQDTNPVVANIFESQSALKVAVGDVHQQMYSFRGAVNAMQQFDADETLYLSRSFRFGQGIADVANNLLQTYKGERRSIQGTADRAHIGPLARGSKYAFIARSNGAVMDEAARAMKLGKSIDFVGGVQGYRLGEAMDVYNLWVGEKKRISNPYFNGFSSFEGMDEYAGTVKDQELKSLITLVKRHGHKLPQLISGIRNAASSKNIPDIILSTTHKSKGLEFENVVLADDFIDLYDEKGIARKIDFSEKEEINIAYVAATRAQRALQPFPELANLIRENQVAQRAKRMPDWAQPASRHRHP